MSTAASLPRASAVQDSLPLVVVKSSVVQDEHRPVRPTPEQSNSQQTDCQDADVNSSPARLQGHSIRLKPFGADDAHDEYAGRSKLPANQPGCADNAQEEYCDRCNGENDHLKDAAKDVGALLGICSEIVCKECDDIVLVKDLYRHNGFSVNQTTIGSSTSGDCSSLPCLLSCINTGILSVNDDYDESPTKVRTAISRIRLETSRRLIDLEDDSDDVSDDCCRCCHCGGVEEVEAHEESCQLTCLSCKDETMLCMTCREIVIQSDKKKSRSMQRAKRLRLATANFSPSLNSTNMLQSQNDQKRAKPMLSA